jgi:hypothetical protein
MPPGYSFARPRAERAVRALDSLAREFDVPSLTPVAYYLTNSVDEVYRILGIETDKRWGPVGGLAQPANRQLFSGIPSLAEDYRHELMHLLLAPLVTSRTTYLVSEGVPTWLGGTSGMDLPGAARALASRLRRRPDITLEAVVSSKLPVPDLYAGAGVFVQMAFERGGIAAVKALFAIGPTAAAFRTESERLFGRPWSAISRDWRARVLSFE